VPISNDAAAQLLAELPDLINAATIVSDALGLMLDEDPSDPEHDTNRAAALAAYDAHEGELRDAVRRVEDTIARLAAPTVMGAQFVIKGTPPSNNENEVRSHWKGRHALKKSWERAIVKELHRLNLPRPIPDVLYVDTEITFPEARRRDVENYREVLSKALGDALSCKDVIVDGARYPGGWIRDDTDKQWKLALRLNDEPGPACTVFRLTWRQDAGSSA
jgi:hypothetical protein